jgi:hypothetical protein
MSLPVGTFFPKPSLEALKFFIVPKGGALAQEIVETCRLLLLAAPVSMIFRNARWLSLLWHFWDPRGLPVVNGLRFLHEIDYNGRRSDFHRTRLANKFQRSGTISNSQSAMSLSGREDTIEQGHFL